MPVAVHPGGSICLFLGFIRHHPAISPDYFSCLDGFFLDPLTSIISPWHCAKYLQGKTPLASVPRFFCASCQASIPSNARLISSSSVSSKPHLSQTSFSIFTPPQSQFPLP